MESTPWETFPFLKRDSEGNEKVVAETHLPCQTNDEGSKGLGSPIPEDFLADGSQSRPQ